MKPTRDQLYRNVLCSLPAEPVPISYVAERLGYALPVAAAVAAKLRRRLNQLEADGLLTCTGQLSLARYALAPSESIRARAKSKRESRISTATPRRDVLRVRCAKLQIAQLVAVLKCRFYLRNATHTVHPLRVRPAVVRSFTASAFEQARRRPSRSTRIPTYPGFAHPLADPSAW